MRPRYPACVHCGEVGLATHMPRVAMRHIGCTETEHRHTVKRKLTKAETQALSTRVCEDITGMGRWRRGRLMSLLM